MPVSYKVLGQQAPAANTETILYTVPSSTSAVVSTVVICNQAASSATYRIAVRPSADSVTAQKHFLAYGITVASLDTITLTIGMTMAASDKITVWGSTATMSFSAFGTEVV